MSLRSKLFALTYDRQMAKVEKTTLRALRESLLAEAGGDVLEIGGGTGANLPFYRPEAGSLTITEPDTAMQEVTAVISRFQAATDALAALGARLGMSEGDAVAPEILAALDEVLAAAGVTDVDGLEPQQRAMMAGLIRTMFAQSADLLGCPT